MPPVKEPGERADMPSGPLVRNRFPLTRFWHAGLNWERPVHRDHQGAFMYDDIWRSIAEARALTTHQDAGACSHFECCSDSAHDLGKVWYRLTFVEAFAGSDAAAHDAARELRETIEALVPRMSHDELLAYAWALQSEVGEHLGLEPSCGSDSHS